MAMALVPYRTYSFSWQSLERYNVKILIFGLQISDSRTTEIEVQTYNAELINENRRCLMRNKESTAGNINNSSNEFCTDHGDKSMFEYGITFSFVEYSHSFQQTWSIFIDTFRTKPNSFLSNVINHKKFTIHQNGVYSHFAPFNSFIHF